MGSIYESDRRLWLLAGVALLGLIGAVVAPPIPQDPAYHDFADTRTVLGVPNFWNVASNLPFLLVGLLGLRELYRGTPAAAPESRPAYLVFFAGIALIGPGSAWYHLAPDNARLVWDRLPMTLAFMALFSLVIGEYLSAPVGKKLLWPLVATGVGSVVYWRLGELGGHGDLRPYALVQFLPMVLIPLILLLFRPRFTGTAYLWAMLAGYVAAKLAELLDEPLFRWLYPVSGHTLKHLLAALGVGCFVLGFRRRTWVVSSDASPRRDRGVS